MLSIPCTRSVDDLQIVASKLNRQFIGIDIDTSERKPDELPTAFVKYHSNVPQPIKKVMVVSQIGFDDGARKRKFEIETAEGIQIQLVTPEDMLKLDSP